MKKIFFNLIPIFLQIACLPLWYIKGDWIGSDGYLSLFEFAFNMLIIPIYLVLVNVRLFEFKWKNILIPCVYMPVIAAAGAYIHFFNWWISGVWIDGVRVGAVDSITVALVNLDAIWSVCFVIGLWIFVNIVRYIKFRRQIVKRSDSVRKIQCERQVDGYVDNN